MQYTDKLPNLQVVREDSPSYSNPKFILIPEVLDLPDLNTTSKLILNIIIQQMDEYECTWILNPKIASYIGIKPNTVSKQISLLEGKSYIKAKNYYNSDGSFKKRSIYSGKKLRMLFPEGYPVINLVEGVVKKGSTPYGKTSNHNISTDISFAIKKRFLRKSPTPKPKRPRRPIDGI